MRRLILLTILLLIIGNAAQAACPAVLTDCPTINANNANFGGVIKFTGTGQPANNDVKTQYNFAYTTFNPLNEGRPFVITTTADVTAAPTNNVTLGLDSELYTTVGVVPFGSTTFNPQGAGGGEHQSAIYGHGQLRVSPPMFGCTPNLDCPGTVFAQNGLNAFADNISTAELFSARSIIVHSPAPSKSFTKNGYATGFGGTTDVWSAISSDDCISGQQASQCLGIIMSANSPYQFNGFGIANPVAEVHSQCGNRTDAATGWISGNTLYLASPPTTSLNFGPGSIVSGPGMVNAHLMSAVSSAPVAGVTPGGYNAYNIDGNPQTLGSQAAPINLTFTETCIQFIASNFSTGGLATYGFIGGVGGLRNTLLASINQGTVANIGTYIDARINEIPSVYIYGAAGGRPAGMAVGFTTPPATAPIDALWVSGSAQVDTLWVNASGFTSISTSENVGIGYGHNGVPFRLSIKGKDTLSTTNAVYITDSADKVIFRLQDDGLMVATGNVNIVGSLTLQSPILDLTPHTPATSAEPCLAGQFTSDTNYLYSCIQTNTWRRAPLAAF